MNKLYLIVIFLLTSFSSFSSFSQEKNIELELHSKKVSLEKHIQELTDSLKLINKEIKHIENQEYLAQFDNSSGLTISAKCRLEGKLRNGSDPLSKILTKVKEGESVNLTDYKSGYWVVNKGPYYGYMSELYIEETETVERFKEELIRQNENMKLEQEKKRKLKLQAEIEQQERQDQIERKKYRESLVSRFGEDVARKLLEGYYWIGMTKEMAEISLGKPSRINTSVGSWGTNEQWIYYSTYLYFENGYLSSYQNSK